MKRVFIIVAALIAALPMAHAATYLFASGNGVPTATSWIDTVGGMPITVWGYSGASLTGSQGSYVFSGVTATLSSDSYGLGLAATSNEILYNGSYSIVVIDFADTSPSNGPELSGQKTATLAIDNSDSGYIIYGGNTAPVTSTISGVSGNVSGLTMIASGSTTGSYNVTVSDAGYNYLVVATGTTCALNVLSVTTSPEPGTFVMAGMALIGLGVVLRKARKR